MRHLADWRALWNQYIGGIVVGAGVATGVLLLAVLLLGLAAVAHRIGGL